MSDDKKPGEKQFGLKKIESQMLETYQDQYFSTISNFLSFVSMERLAYPVTQNTKFAVEGETLRVWEDETQPVGPNNTGDVVSSVSTDTSDNTGEAMKGTK